MSPPALAGTRGHRSILARVPGCHQGQEGELGGQGQPSSRQTGQSALGCVEGSPPLCLKTAPCRPITELEAVPVLSPFFLLLKTSHSNSLLKYKSVGR